MGVTEDQCSDFLCVNFHVHRCYSIIGYSFALYSVCLVASLNLLFPSLREWWWFFLFSFNFFFFSFEIGHKGKNTENRSIEKTHLTPYIRIFIVHCAIINVILLISNHLLLLCHINRYRLFFRSTTPSNRFIFIIISLEEFFFLLVRLCHTYVLVHSHFGQMCHCLFLLTVI